MALVKCRECGHEISDRASYCPNCGAPNASLNTYSSDAEHKKRVDSYIFRNANMFPYEEIENIRQTLYNLSEDTFNRLQFIELRDPTLLLVLSIFIGHLGVDRFLIDDITNGILKLILTLMCGIGFIWWIIDIFLIRDKTREYNLRIIHEAIDRM